jgi:formamidopyrimidine-DNA glycosylase
VSAKEIKALYAKTVAVLDQAIKLRGTSMRNYRDSSGEKGEFLSLIKVYGKEGKKCVKCKQLVKKIVQAGRSTFFCSSCQK